MDIILFVLLLFLLLSSSSIYQESNVTNDEGDKLYMSYLEKFYGVNPNETDRILQKSKIHPPQPLLRGEARKIRLPPRDLGEGWGGVSAFLQEV
jgi:hypothetical protein